MINKVKTSNSIPNEIEFPKKRFLGNSILTLFFVFEIFFSMSEFFEMLNHLQKTEFPFVEIMAINLRLQETCYSKLQLVVYTGKVDELELFKQSRFALWDQLKEFDNIYKEKIAKAPEVQINFDRADLSSIEDKMIKSIEQRDLKTAQQLFESSEFQKAVINFQGVFQALSEKLNEDREHDILRFLNKGYFIFGSSIVGLILIFALWAGVWRSFQYNLRRSRMMKEELEIERARAFESSKLVTLGEMAGGLAHEINSPLSVILTNTHLIKMKMDNLGLDSSPFDKSLLRITKTVEQIAKLIRSLRVISGNSTQEKFASTTFRYLVDEALELIQWKAKKNNIEIRTSENQLNLEFDCKVVQMVQVLINLLQNSIEAISASSCERWIEISAKENGESIQIAVKDSGYGIEKENISKLFNPFFTTKAIGQAMGLGLSISFQLVKDQGGRLFYDASSPHTCFVIEIAKKNPNNLSPDLKNAS